MLKNLNDIFSSNLFIRFVSAIIIATIFIASLILSKHAFAVLMLATMALMLSEWYDFNKYSILYLIIGWLFITLSVTSIIIINYLVVDFQLVMLFFVAIWATDAFAMLAGRNIGGIKLAPTISPNKTWSGFIVGVLAAGLTVFFISTMIGYPAIYDLSIFAFMPLYVYAICLGVIAQMSDLFVSYFKRKANLKDSGDLIPGHGGFLDRFDSIILCGPTLLLFIL